MLNQEFMAGEGIVGFVEKKTKKHYFVIQMFCAETCRQSVHKVAHWEISGNIIQSLKEHIALLYTNKINQPHN